ncbi:hypothetical protein B0H14DRAFT_3473050 [Mycena olivaceomarginata]|nr:hypothetical protein B0H14DRAFT_3473050 [Mycena olivaceomarginata]
MSCMLTPSENACTKYTILRDTTRSCSPALLLPCAPAPPCSCLPHAPARPPLPRSLHLHPPTTAPALPLPPARSCPPHAAMLLHPPTTAHSPSASRSPPLPHPTSAPASTSNAARAPALPG